MSSYKPVLGITMGDATGCGPEIIVKSLMEPRFYAMSRPVVIGDAKIMQRAADIVGSRLKIRKIMAMADAGQQADTIDVWDFDNLPVDLPFATVDARAGKAAYEYVAKGVELAMSGQIDAIVTAPLHKEAMNQGGYHYAGHTEILGALSKTKDYAMMLVGGPLRVIHVSTHVSLREACNRVKQARVLKVIELADESCKLLGIAEPRVAVAGLNPHAGEAGMFGSEEIDEIMPAIEAAKAKGICATGPIAPDTVFYRAALKGHFDIVVCMYHDQGHIPMKVLSFETGVNVTVGLPFIRTSVDHGTAFGKAGKGTADHRSLNESILLGAKMAETRRLNQPKGGA